MPLCLFLVGPLHISQVELFQRTIPFQGRHRRRRHRHFPKELAALAFVPDDLLFFLVSVGFDGFWWGISRSAPQNHSREVSFQEVNEDEASNFFAAYFLEGRWNGLLLGTEYLAKLSLKTTPLASLSFSSYFFAHPILLLCSSPSDFMALAKDGVLVCYVSRREHSCLKINF